MRDLAQNDSWFSLNGATVKERWGLHEIVDGCARHGISAVAPWRDQVAAVGLEASARLIRDAGLRVSSLCRGGSFTVGADLNLDDNRRAVDEAVALGAECLVLVVGGLVEGSNDLGESRRRVAEAIERLLEYARPRQVPLALEPLHPMAAADRGCINTLEQALDLCDRLGDGLGVAIDAHHVWWDPKLSHQIARAGSRILAYHVCDWLVPTTDLVADRGMPGDGVIELRRLREMVERAGYDGCCEIEIFSTRNWWRRDPDEVLPICLERYRTVV